jgi:hypothetical protein
MTILIFEKVVYAHADITAVYCVAAVKKRVIIQLTD